MACATGLSRVMRLLLMIMKEFNDSFRLAQHFLTRPCQVILSGDFFTGLCVVTRVDNVGFNCLSWNTAVGSLMTSKSHKVIK